MYDIIGDIHGPANELAQLLTALGYRKHGSGYRHGRRQVIFVGDFIDRGPAIEQVLQIVRSMVESGAAHAVMGNYEFNALAFHTPHPTKPGEYLRPHSEKNVQQHQSGLGLILPDRKRVIRPRLNNGRIPNRCHQSGIAVIPRYRCRPNRPGS